MIYRKIVIFGLVASFFFLNKNAVAQSAVTAEQKKTAAETVYKFLDQYNAAANLKSYDKSTATKEAIEKYKSLFTSGAVIVDDIIPAENGKITNKPVYKTIEHYIQDALEFYPNGLQVSVVRANADYKLLGKDTVVVAVEKVVSGVAANTSGVGTNLYRSRTRQLLYVLLSSGLTEARITKSVLLSGEITCADCAKPSDKPVAVHYKTPYEFGITVMVDGLGCSTLGNTPDFTKMNYLSLNTAADPNGKYKSGFHNKIGYGVGGHVAFDFMFTKQKNVGFGLDLSYTYQGTSFKQDELDLQYEVVGTPNGLNNSTGGSYLRDHYSSNSVEKLSSSNVGISLLFKSQSDPNSKATVGYFLNVGPTYYLFNQTVSHYNSTESWGAYGHWNPNQGWQYAQTDDGHDFNLTQPFLSKHPNQVGATTNLINALKAQNWQIDFAKQVSGKSDAYKYGLALGGMLAAGISVKLSPALSFLLGANVNVIYCKGNGVKSNTNLADNYEGYNTLLYAIDQGIKVSYGATLGLKFRIKSKF